MDDHSPKNIKLDCFNFEKKKEKKNHSKQLTVIIFVSIRLTSFVVIVAATTRHAVSDCSILSDPAQNHCQ